MNLESTPGGARPRQTAGIPARQAATRSCAIAGDTSSRPATARASRCAGGRGGALPTFWGARQSPSRGTRGTEPAAAEAQEALAFAPAPRATMRERRPSTCAERRLNHPGCLSGRHGGLLARHSAAQWPELLPTADGPPRCGKACCAVRQDVLQRGQELGAVLGKVCSKRKTNHLTTTPSRLCLV